MYLGLSSDIIFFYSNQKFKKKIYLKKFDYEKYPSYINISINASQYAWKPEIIKEIFHYFKKYLIWLDSGCEITGSISNITKYIKKKDIWSLSSNHTIIKYTYFKMSEYFKVNNDITNNYCWSAASIGFKYKSTLVENRINKWYICDLNINCISAKGSSLKNHRYDQSAFSILVNLYDRKEICYLSGFNITVHVDSIVKNLNKSVMMKRIIQFFI